MNWKIRYSKIMLDTPEMFDPAFSVVEVGCGPAGISEFLERKVIGVEPNPVVARNGNLEIVEGSILALPFSDGEIDYVLCVDVLEHLAAGVRTAAICELLRVARRKVIISCPCDVWAKAGEIELKQMFLNFGADVPGWLEEHLAFGLPLVREILDAIIAAGCGFEVAGNETVLQHYAGIALDWFFPMAQGVNKRLHGKSPLLAPVGGNEWDIYYSFVFTLDKLARHPRSELPRGAAPVTGGQALYAVYHKEFPISHLDRITPIFTGDLALDHAQTGLTDICVETDRLPNRRWSELSAIYKIWREGPVTAVVGFCHYRRLFDFADYDAPVGRETNVTVAALASGGYRLYDADIVASVRDGSRLIVAKPHDTTNTIFEHYCELHNTNDYLELINHCSATKSPLLPFFMEQFSDHFLLANNMFVVSWALFCELCGFWFEILGAVGRKIPERETSAYQRRDVAFLSERIFDAWVRYRKAQGNEVLELPILLVGAEGGG